MRERFTIKKKVEKKTLFYFRYALCMRRDGSLWLSYRENPAVYDRMPTLYVRVVRVRLGAVLSQQGVYALFGDKNLNIKYPSSK